MRCSLRSALLLSVAFCLYIVGALFILGMRSDLATKLHDPVYVFELLHILTIGISGAFCALWLRIPDMRGQKLDACNSIISLWNVFYLDHPARCNGTTCDTAYPLAYMPHTFHCFWCASGFCNCFTIRKRKNNASKHDDADDCFYLSALSAIWGCA